MRVKSVRFSEKDAADTALTKLLFVTIGLGSIFCEFVCILITLGPSGVVFLLIN